MQMSMGREKYATLVSRIMDEEGTRIYSKCLDTNDLMKINTAPPESVWRNL